MSNLISRKKICDYIKGKINPYGKPFEGTAYELGLKIMRYIDAMDSDYDIDKVVEKLEENASRYTKKYLTPYGNNGYRDVKAISIHKAVEIIKQDGAGTETETIRDKAVKWNNNSSKRVPYEFIDYVEGKREIGVSNNVCEWKSTSDGEFIQNAHTKRLYSNEPSMKNVYCNTCAKKIKVVE